MHAVLRLSDRLAALVVTVGRWMAWIAVLLMLIILFDIVTRFLRSADWITDYPTLNAFLQWIDPYAGSTKLQELEWHLHGVLFLMCLGYAYVKNAHVRIELVRDHLSTKVRAVIEILGIVLLLGPFCYLVISFGIDFAERAYQRNEGSSAMTGLPQRWIIKSFVPLGFAFVAAAGLSVLLRCVVVLFGDDDDREEASTFLQGDVVAIDEEELEPSAAR